MMMGPLGGCAVSGDPLPGASLAARVADRPEHAAVADGDLWANCWGKDGSVYAAYGDGNGFGSDFADTGVVRIDGELGDLEGENLAAGAAVGQVWSGEDFTRKPTGMLCRDGILYLAVQDLRKDFNEAPASTIARSTDHGLTWQWDTSRPMFSDHVFTTVFFLDYGRDSEHAPEEWVYVYGLDGNWRDSFDDSVPDPEDLFLARASADAVQERSAWQFFAGLDGKNPTWSADIADRASVLHDGRRLYASSDDPDAGQTVGGENLSVISQGGVVYLAALDRYVYTSWTEFTYEFYEAPKPWGPWTLFISRDFGSYPWTEESYGGYATTIPSKFISDDGRTMWVQSNVCPCAPAGKSSYYFGLRKLELALVEGGG